MNTLNKISTLMVLGLIASGSAFAAEAKKTGQNDSRECQQIATGQKSSNDTTGSAQSDQSSQNTRSGSARDSVRGVGTQDNTKN